MDEKGKLNIALVGCGGMAVNYRKQYTKIPGAQLSLVIDTDEEVARNAAQELGEIAWSTDFKAVLVPEIDIVDISTPNYLHAEQAIAALKAGKNVLLQKPITPTIKEAEEVIETAVQMKKKIGMYMSLFDMPIFYEVKKLIESGALGKVSNIYCRGAHNGGLSISQNNWRKSVEKTGGGAFIQLTVHFINMIQWILNDKITSVAAFSKNNMCPNVGGDDVTNASCEFESGILGSLESSYSSSPNILAVYGTKGYIMITDEYKLDIKLNEKYNGEFIKYNDPNNIVTLLIDKTVNNNQYDQHIAFVNSIIENKPVPVPAEVGLYDLKIVKAVYKSAEEKRTVKINEL